MLLAVATLSAAACMNSSTVGQPPAPAPRGPGAAGGVPPAAAGTGGEMQRLYRSMGLVAGTGAIPFVASVSFLTAPHPDTTLTLVALSLPSRALSFTREGERYTAEYTVRLEARRGVAVAAQLEAKETVRVSTFRETARTDESVIWQQYLRLAPGRYTLAIAIKDESGLRNAAEEVSLEVPKLTGGAIGSPIGVYEAIPRSSVDSIPRLLARPRSTVTFGVDSLYPVYIEAVGDQAPSSVNIRVVGEGDFELWNTTVDLQQRLNVRSTAVGVPVARLGVGISNITVTAAGRADTARARVLVSLGDDLPISTFEEMLGYLRYFATADKLKLLRDAPLTQRADAWAKFLKDTDPAPGTAENEALRDYFARIRAANQRYREDGPVGWQTDRGTTFVALGDPDNIYDSSLQDPSARVRQQVWEYRALRLQLVYIDQTGFGRWRLSSSARAELDNAIRRKLASTP
jgi:GWxTD domain-containing protein